jgi:hypothetical protein
MIIKSSVFAVNKTTLHHYEDQLVSAVYSGNNSKPTKALYGAKFRVTEVKESGTVHINIRPQKIRRTRVWEIIHKSILCCSMMHLIQTS